MREHARELEELPREAHAEQRAAQILKFENIFDEKNNIVRDFLDENSRFLQNSAKSWQNV